MTAPEKSLRFYQNSRCTTELGGPVTRSVFQHPGGLLAQRTGGAEASLSLLAVDTSNTVMTAFEHASKTQYRYTPYGQRPDTGDSKHPLGFNGEQLDWVTGCYLLGSYRLLSPVLQRMSSSDSASPFEEGGLNPYAYCSGDPVNNVDPTGRFAVANIIFAAAVISGIGAIGTATASFLVKDPKTRDTLVFATEGLIGLTAGIIGGYFIGKIKPSARSRTNTLGTPNARSTISNVPPTPASVTTGIPHAPTGAINAQFSFGTPGFNSDRLNAQSSRFPQLPRVQLSTTGPAGPTARYIPRPTVGTSNIRQP